MNSEVRFNSPNLKITITLGVILAATIIILAMLFRFEFSLILLAIAGSIALIGVAGLVGIGGKIVYRFKVWRLDIATRQQNLRLATYKADKAQLEAFVLSFPSSQRQLVQPDAPIRLIEATASYKALPADTQAPIELLPALDSVQRVLIVGPSNAGKTDLLKWIVTRRVNDSQVVIIDPHSYVDKWPYGQVIGIGRNYPEIDRTLEALVQLMQKRYQQIGRGEVREENHKRVCVCVDEWRAITGNLPKAGDALKTLLTESRKASMSMFVASHSDRAKPLGLSGEYDLKSGFVIIRLSIQNGERVATIDNGDGPQPATLPGPYISSQVIESDGYINLEVEPSPTEAAILNLRSEGASYNEIARQVFGHTGGQANRTDKANHSQIQLACTVYRLGYGPVHGTFTQYIGARMMLQQESKTTLPQFVITKRAVIYARVSTDEQAESGTSLDNQVEKSLEYAQANDMQVVGVFTEDFTGTTLDRPEFNKAVGLLRSKQADSLIVYKTNRLVRDEWGVNLLLLLRGFKTLGVELHYSQNNRQVNLNDPFQALMLSIEGWQAGEDRNEVVRRLTEGREKRAEQGGILVSGNSPFGYEVVKQGKHHQLEINEYEADIVRLIYQLYTQGLNGIPLTISEVRQHLDSLKLPTAADLGKSIKEKKGKGKVWNHSTIHHILRNETDTGVWYYNKHITRNGKRVKRPKDEWIAVDIPAIVDRETWKNAQTLLETNRRKKRGRKANRVTLLNRRIKCQCGYSCYLTPKKSKLYYYYYCHGRRKDITWSNCNLPKIRGEKVDAIVWDWIERILNDEEYLKQGIARYLARQKNELEPLKHRLESIEAEISDREKELSQLQKSYRELKSDKAKRTKAALLADIERLESLLDSLEGQRDKAKAKLETAQQTEQGIQQAIARMKQIRQEVDEGLDIARMSIEQKRWFVERLNVKATLKIKDGKKFVSVICYLDEDEFELSKTSYHFDTNGLPCTQKRQGTSRSWGAA